MSSQSQDKLPKYVFRTAFSVFRFKRNVPQDIRATVGKTFFYKALGKDYKEAMRSYSTALLEFDSFVSAYRNEAPVRETILEVVKAEFGEESMLQLDRGQVDENLEFALMDLSDKVEGSVPCQTATQPSEPLLSARLGYLCGRQSVCPSL